MKGKFSFDSRIIGVTLIALLVGMIVIAVILIGLSRDFRRQERILSADNEKHGELIELLKQSTLMLSRDSNQVRSILSLPPSAYPDFREEEPEEESSESRNADDPGFFKAVEFIEKRQKETELVQEFKKYYADAGFIASLKESGLSFAHTDSLSGRILKGNLLYLTVAFHADSKKTTLLSITGQEVSAQNFNAECASFIKKSSAEADAHYKKASDGAKKLLSLRDDKEIRTTLAEKKLVFGQPAENAEGTSLSIRGERSESLILSFDTQTLSYRVGSESFTDWDAFLSAAREHAKAIDTRSRTERAMDEAKASITGLLADKGFVSYLSAKKLTLSTTAREDSDYFYYDLTDSAGKRTGSFAVQRDVGEIYVMDQDDVPLVSLKTLKLGTESSSGAKKKLVIPERVGTISDLYKTSSSVSFLLCGAHENNTDTIMVVYADKERIVIIGFPRDLYWKGRKINSYYRINGPDYFVRQVAQITGLAIDKYVVIDMFAFIDVVNILGGIDVELAEDLVDPTYKVKNKDGTWSTLFYPKGMHHLDGVETLRLARSRHSSSDFDRSSRQQQILEALKNRVEDLDIRDMGKAYDLVRTLSSYVQTNFTFFELVDIFSRYQKTPITRQEVLSTKNVLYTTYSNVYLLKVEEASAAVPSENGEGTEVQKEHQVGEALAAEGREDATEQAPETIDEDFDKGAWILLPLNDDWNLIKWYIRTLIGGEKNE